MTLDFFSTFWMEGKAVQAELRQANLSRQTLEVLKKAFHLGFTVDKIMEVASIRNDNRDVNSPSSLSDRKDYVVNVNGLLADRNFRQRHPAAISDLDNLVQDYDLHDRATFEAAVKAILKPIMPTDSNILIHYTSPNEVARREGRLQYLRSLYEIISPEICALSVRVIQASPGLNSDWLMECDGHFAADPNKKTARKLAILARSGMVKGLRTTQAAPFRLNQLLAEQSVASPQPRYYRTVASRAAK